MKQKSCVLDDNKNGFEKKVHGQVFAELTFYMEQTANENKVYIFKLVDLSKLHKTKVRELGGHTPNRIHTTKLKERLMLHIENLKEYQDSNNQCYIPFDNDAGTVLKTFYKKSYDDEAFVLSEAAKIICRDVSLVDSTSDGNFTRNCQQHYLPQSVKLFVDNIVQGSKKNSSRKQLTQSTLTISQLIVQDSIKRIRQNVKTQNVHLRRNDYNSQSVFFIEMNIMVIKEIPLKISHNDHYDQLYDR